MIDTLPPLKPLRIGRYLAPVPIVQGAMAVRVSGARLAAAVANAGGIGVISSLGLGLMSPYFTDPSQRKPFPVANRLALIDELHRARSLSPHGLIGVNVLVATRDYATLVRTAAAHGADLIITGAGAPLDLPELVADYPQVALVPMVCGLEAAQQICRTWREQYHRWPDALIVENSQAVGGHIGTTCGVPTEQNRIEVILPQIRDYIQQDLQADIPLIATGGVWDRADVDRLLALGAQGVQVGSRFITTEECDAHPRYKEFHLKAKPEDIVLVPSPVGKSGRALRNRFAEQAIAGSPDLVQPCLANCLTTCLCRDTKRTYCIAQALANAAQGNLEEGLVFSGANIGRADRLQPVAEVMASLIGKGGSTSNHS